MTAIKVNPWTTVYKSLFKRGIVVETDLAKVNSKRMKKTEIDEIVKKKK